MPQKPWASRSLSAIFQVNLFTIVPDCSSILSSEPPISPATSREFASPT